MIPTGGCHRRIRRKRLLVAVSGDAADSSRTGWVPNTSTIHPQDPRHDATDPSASIWRYGNEFRGEPGTAFHQFIYDLDVAVVEFFSASLSEKTGA